MFLVCVIIKLQVIKLLKVHHLALFKEAKYENRNNAIVIMTIKTKVMLFSRWCFPQYPSTSRNSGWDAFSNNTLPAGGRITSATNHSPHHKTSLLLLLSEVKAEKMLLTTELLKELIF